jgi:carbon-monoxide dehydrogenase large subunit
VPLVVPDRWLLARDKVAYVGDPIALVVGETLEAALDGAEALAVDIEALPAVVGAASATSGTAETIWSAAPDNVCFEYQAGNRTGVESAFAQADHIARLEYRINRIAAQPMETRSAIAAFEPSSGRWTLWCGHQKPHLLRSQLAGMFGVSQNMIRVVVPDVGGGFGMKGSNFPEFGLAMWAARELGRPVRWVATRSEGFLSDDQARDNNTTTELALDKDGRFLGLRVRSVADLGAYLSDYGPHSSTNNLGGLSGVYRIPAVLAEVTGVFTNSASISPYRGAGRPEATYAIERIIDVAAREMGIDRVELRRRNLIPESEMPFATGFMFSYDTGAFERGMDKALTLAEWNEFPARRDDTHRRGLLRGIGMAIAIEQAGGIFEEAAELRFDADGGLTLFSGTVSNGQGHETAFRQVLGELLGLPGDRIRVVQGDTDRVFHGFGTFGSRSLAVGGAAVARAADKIIAKGRILAAHLLDADEGQLTFDSGYYRVEQSNRGIGLIDIAKASFQRASLPAGFEVGLTERAVFVPPQPTFPNGTHVCEVEIDPRTGAVQIVRYTVVDDVGRVVNPQLLEGQIHGGICQGLGQVLMEDIIYEQDTGQLLSGSFQDYAMPRADDLPELRLGHNNVPSTTNPLGLKGAGEAGTVGALPAITSAIIDALSAFGVTHLDMPITSEKVWRAIQDARHNEN